MINYAIALLRIISDLTELNREAAGKLLEKSDRQVKLALLMHWTGLDAAAGEALLNRNQGNLRASSKHQPY